MKIAVRPSAPDCREWWSHLYYECPSIYEALRRYGEAELTQTRWEYLQALPGFSEGPPVELVQTSTRVAIGLPEELAEAIATSAKSRGASFKAECRALLGSALRDLPQVANSVARAIAKDGQKPTEQDRKRAYAALSCARNLPPRD